MTGRPRSATNEAIFHAVAEVVTTVGPGGLTLAAVASRVGLSAPALAQRFGSKRGLLLAFAASEADSAAMIFKMVREEGHGPVAAIRAALVSFTEKITTREALANNLAFLQMDLTDPELREHAAAQSRAMRAQITVLLEDAVADGDLAVDQPVALAMSLYTTYCGALVTWAIDGTGELADWLGLHIDRVLEPHRL
jgi:AcrR family transcriptional regulator